MQPPYHAYLGPFSFVLTLLSVGCCCTRISRSYNDQFHLYITTRLPNPHYAPELQVKVSLLLFAITPEGLEDQMLATVVAKESPELEQKKNTLVVQNARM